ncbi:hypothetical protein MHYP_G00069710 [Metynnis hypsauchen]
MSSVAMEMRVASPFHLITDERSLCFAQQKQCIVSHPAISLSVYLSGHFPGCSHASVNHAPWAKLDLYLSFLCGVYDSSLLVIHLSSQLWPCPCSFLLLPLMSFLPVSSPHHPVFVPGVQTTAVLGSSSRDSNRKRQPE